MNYSPWVEFFTGFNLFRFGLWAHKLWVIVLGYIPLGLYSHDPNFIKNSYLLDCFFNRRVSTLYASYSLCIFRKFSLMLKLPYEIGSWSLNNKYFSEFQRKSNITVLVKKCLFLISKQPYLTVSIKFFFLFGCLYKK